MWLRIAHPIAARIDDTLETLCRRPHVNARCWTLQFCATVLGPAGRIKKQIVDWLQARSVTVGGPHPSVAFLIQDESDFAGEVVNAITQFRLYHPEAAVAVVFSHPSEDLAVLAFRAGAADYLPWPASETELSAVLSRLAKPVCGKASTEQQQSEESSAMRKVRDPAAA